jgi:hypothetical protein
MRGLSPSPFHQGGLVTRDSLPVILPLRAQPAPLRYPQPDEMCGFPLHLPYGAHGHVAIYGDTTVCVDCEQRWDTNDPAPPLDICIPRRPLGGFNEDHIQ